MNKSDWTPNESRIIFELYLKFGSKWSKIKKFLEGRTENNIKNRFYSGKILLCFKIYVFKTTIYLVLRKVKGRKDKEMGYEVHSKQHKGDKLTYLMKYIDDAVQYLNADINNLPRTLSLDSNNIIYT